MKTLSKFLTASLLTSLVISCSTINKSSNISISDQDVSANKVSKTSQINWQDQIIYFIFTDRFSNGDKNNDFNVKKNDPWAYHGGDLQGIINKLDYIKDIGATAIWITPPMDNRDYAFKADFGGGKIQEIWGYHGYWTKDFFKVDEHLGTMAKMRELVNKAHSKGIKVILDIVMNHVDYDHKYAKGRYDKNAKYKDWFNLYGVIKNHNDPWWQVHGELAELPDLNQNNPKVVDHLTKASKWWIDQTGVDGFRLDTVKHVDHKFWRQYSKDIHNHAGKNFLLLGEVYDGVPENNAAYIRDGLDSTFDFPFYYAIKDVFGSEQSMKRLGKLFAKDKVYPNAKILSPFIDNHDVNRFIHDAGNNGQNKLKLALSFLLTMRGMPMIYYGTEIGMAGGHDPDNRRDMTFNKSSQLKSHLKKLTSIRKNQLALRRGTQLEMWQDDQVYSYLRTTGDANKEVITVLNNSNRKETRTIQIRAESKMKNGTKLKNLLGNDQIVVKNKKVTVTLGPKEAKIFAVGN